MLPTSFAEDPDRLRRFEQEARAAGGLDHPNVLSLHDLGTEAGAPYLVFELLEGETLRRRLADGALSAAKTIDYGAQIASGLAAAHAKGIVHRDLKPENLFVTKDGRLKILDFGLAKLRPAPGTGNPGSEVATLSALTDMGTVLGTTSYMSPEQAQGLSVDHRSDVFSFGSILYEAITGERAFHGDTPAAVLAAIAKDEPSELAIPSGRIPPGLEHVLRRCLEKRPEHRFHSAHDLGLALEAVSGASGARGAAPPVGARRGFGAVVLATALLAATAGAYLMGRNAAPTPVPTWRQLTFRRGTVGNARFSADGNSVYYSARWEGKPDEVFATRLDGVESRPLGLTKTALAAVVAGEMAVVLHGDLMDPLGWTTGRLARVPLEGGTPRPVVADVSDADWLKGSDRMAVVRVENERWRLEYPVGTILYQAPPSRLGSPRLAPRGDRVAFMEFANASTESGLVAVVDRSGRREVLTEVFGGSSGGLAWSPDGNEVWFTAGREGSARALYAVSLSGRLRTLLQSAGQLILDDVLPDGRVLLHQGHSRSEAAGLFPGDAGEHDYSWFDGTSVTSLTPDGRTVVFQEGGVAGGRRESGYLRRTDGSSPIRLGDGWAMSLSDDGRWVLSGYRDDAGRTGFRLIPTDAGEARGLPRGSIDGYEWGFLSPDGKRALIVGSEKGRPPRCFLQELPDGEPRAVTSEGVVTLGTHPFLEPDGKSIVIDGQRASSSIPWRVPARTEGSPGPSSGTPRCSGPATAASCSSAKDPTFRRGSFAWM